LKRRDQMVDALDFLRKAALHKRINGVAGGNRILWQDKDFIKLHDHAMSARREALICDDPTIIKSRRTAVIPDKASLAKMGIELRDFSPDDYAFLCLITNATTDHLGDSVKPGGVNDSLFGKNAPVLDSHDSSKPPVASSSRPFMSGDNLLAIARFPKPGISANSDQIIAAIRARLLRGVSIGFIPLKWSFSKDPSRPMGVDFNEIKLIEFSMCSIPCNPDCYVLGSVASSQSAPSDASKNVDRRREARELTARARSIVASMPDPVPITREQRIAEASAFRREAMAAGK
jgi:HK97 family phage prohead protease